jgi:hypothetical protein
MKKDRGLIQLAKANLSVEQISTKMNFAPAAIIKARLARSRRSSRSRSRSFVFGLLAKMNGNFISKTPLLF